MTSRAKAARRRQGSPFGGTWRIVETELWDREALDLVVPAHITFGADGLGQMELIAIAGAVDYRLGSRDGLPCVEFSWSGSDDADPACGRGWALLKGGRLEGRLFIHQGDESGFIAKRK